MKKKYENYWNMYSNCFNTIKASAQKKNSNSPSKKKFPMSKSYISLSLHLYSNSTLKVLPVKVEQDHAQYGKNKAKDI